jgi:glycosidase
MKEFFMKPIWTKDAIFYHIYPLGLCGAPQRNHFDEGVESRLDSLIPWLDHIHSLGANSIYLGPVFESSSHGYDTTDYYRVDRRLGDHQSLVNFSKAVHHRSMRLVLDAVFNHVGRDFWAFKDVLEHGEQSAYKDWFTNLRFEGHSPYGDPFQYESWQGHYALVKLNLSNPNVRAHLFDAVAMWIDAFGIDGLRLDAADCIDMDFLQALHDFTKRESKEFWLMGEVVHGDYRKWVNPQTLDSVTNYESYKGLYSSLNDANYHEIAYSLDRQFGPGGIYRDLELYNFVDNHDVNRVASQLAKPTYLYPLHILLFTMPGIPSIYYGSEWGIQGKKEQYTDLPLRPALNLDEMQKHAPHPNLAHLITKLASIRSQVPALRYGDYQALHVGGEQLAFIRQDNHQRVLVALNSSGQPVQLSLPVSGTNGRMKDWLNWDETYPITDGQLLITIPPTWGRILTDL